MTAVSAGRVSVGTLRSLFGPSKGDIWRQFSNEIGGSNVESGFGTSEKVQVTHGEWTLTLDAHAELVGTAPIFFTRLRAPYVNPDGFRFTVYRKGFFSEIAKRFGMQDVQIGDEGFDRDFIIKGTDEAKLRMLFLSPRIRALIAIQAEIVFAVKHDEGWFGPDFPEDIDELYFSVVGVINDVGRLKLLYELFGETLDRLCRMGSA